MTSRVNTLHQDNQLLIPLIYLSIFFIAAIIGADLLTYKLIHLFGFTASAAIIFFPLTYTIGDITTEVYGKALALKMVYIAIAAEFYVDTLLSLISNLDYSVNNELTPAFRLVLGPLQKVFWGNIIALATSALLNVRIMSKLKQMYQGQYFIVRSLIATFSSEIVYIIIAYTIWFWGVVPFPTLLVMMSVSMSFKIIFALCIAYPAKRLTQKIMNRYGINTDPL